MLRITYRTLLFFSFTFLSIYVYGQSNKERLLELANEAFKANHYQSAIDYCKQAEAVAPNDADVKYMLAEGYLNTFRYEEAEANYQKVISLDSADYPLVLYKLGLCRKMNNRYEDAAETFDQFLKYAETTSFPEKEAYIEQAKIESEGCSIAMDHSSIAFRQFNLTNLPAPVNSRFNDYAAYPYRNDNTIVITSGREEAIGKKEDSGFDEDHTDCFRFAKDSSGWKELNDDDNFKNTNDAFHEGAGSFNRDNTKYYFTRCADTDCAIYFTQLKNGKWQPMAKLNGNINIAGTESKHPFVSITGDTLFFISNRPGGFGMNDVYMSIAQAEDQWGAAINLGGRINTKLNEASPFYLSKEKLFWFSSQGHPGYGGLDVFTVHNLFTKPEIKNIGKPFNSQADDLYFVFGEKTGYLSSNRIGGKGKFDIYSFSINAEESVIAVLENQDPKKKNTLNGEEVVGSVNTFNTKDSDVLSISGILYDQVTNKVLKNVEVQLADENGKIVKVVTTNRKGFFRYTKVDPNKHYKVLIKRTPEHTAHHHEAGVANLKIDEYKEEVLSSLDMSKLQPAGNAYISGSLMDRTANKAMKETEVVLTDEHGQAIQSAMTDANGNFMYSKVTSTRKYNVTVNGTTRPASGKHDLGVTNLNIEGYKEETLSAVDMSRMQGAGNTYISGRLLDRTTGKALREAEVALLDENGKVVQTAFTDEDGRFTYSKISSDHTYKVSALRNSGLLPDKHELAVTDLNVEGYKEEMLSAVNMQKMQASNNTLVSGRLMDRTTAKPLREAEVVLLDENGRVIQTTMTDENGFFTYSKIPSDHNYKVSVMRNSGLAPGKHELGVTDLKITDYKEKEIVSSVNTFHMDGVENVSISGNLYDHETGIVMKEVEVLLLDENGQVVKMTSTNEDGFFKYTEIPLHQNYKVTIKRKSGLTSDVHALAVTNLKIEGHAEKTVSGKFENIYFDFDKTYLRPEAIKALDDLSILCKNNPSIQVEIDAFTDFAGPDIYNDDLSRRRGNAAFDYLIKSGVDRAALVVIAKGNRDPIASNETLGGRQLNRRVEFIIKGMGEYTPSIATYIIEAKMTLYSLAKKYHTTIDELKNINGLTSSHIETYRPLRVPLKERSTEQPVMAKQEPVKQVPSRLPAVTTYKVKRGDTIFSIAVVHHMTVERFKEINSIEDEFILLGQIVKVEVR